MGASHELAEGGGIPVSRAHGQRVKTGKPACSMCKQANTSERNMHLRSRKADIRLAEELPGVDTQCYSIEAVRKTACHPS
jgi:hypothetical protein